MTSSAEQQHSGLEPSQRAHCHFILFPESVIPVPRLVPFQSLRFFSLSLEDLFHLYSPSAPSFLSAMRMYKLFMPLLRERCRNNVNQPKFKTGRLEDFLYTHLQEPVALGLLLVPLHKLICKYCCNTSACREFLRPFGQPCCIYLRTTDSSFFSFSSFSFSNLGGLSTFSVV